MLMQGRRLPAFPAIGPASCILYAGPEPSGITGCVFMVSAMALSGLGKGTPSSLQIGPLRAGRRLTLVADRYILFTSSEYRKFM
jgi:hypothetical protein